MEKVYGYSDLRETEEAIYVGHVSAHNMKFRDRNLLDQLIEVGTGLCEVGHLSVWRDFGDEESDFYGKGSWYGRNVWLIVHKWDSKKKVKEATKKLRDLFKDWA